MKIKEEVRGEIESNKLIEALGPPPILYERNLRSLKKDRNIIFNKFQSVKATKICNKSNPEDIELNMFLYADTENLGGRKL